MAELGSALHSTFTGAAAPGMPEKTRPSINAANAQLGWSLIKVDEDGGETGELDLAQD